ncbi:DUF3592 domain-containing protein [Streptomyces olivaceus]
MVEILFSVSFIALPLFMIGKGVREISTKKRLERVGVRVTGVVTAVHRSADKGSVATQEIEFRDVLGGQHRFKCRAGMSYSIEGAWVEVYYAPNNPKMARLAEKGIAHPCSMIVFGVVMVGSVIWTVVAHR